MTYAQLSVLAGIPVEGKSSVCLICMKLDHHFNYSCIIIISLGQIFFYRILQTHHARAHTLTRAHICAHMRTHVHTRAHTCTHVHTRAHTCTHVHTRAHTCTHVHTRAHTCTHVHTRAHTQPSPPSPSAAQAIAIRWRPTNRDGPLRLRQCRSLTIQINTRTGDPIHSRFWKFFAYKKIARPNGDANS